MSRAHDGARAELARIEHVSAGALRVLSDPPTSLPVGPDWSAVAVSLDTGFTRVGAGGVQLGEREEIELFLPPGYPFDQPIALLGHDGFAKLPNVVGRRGLCLYDSANGWDHRAGMYGFIRNLVLWFTRAAGGILKAVGPPAHPPVARGLGSGGYLVLRADEPPAPASVTDPTLRFAALSRHDAGRSDVLGWFDLDAIFSAVNASVLPDQLRELARPHRMQPPTLAPVVLLAEPMGFQFPPSLPGLLTELARRGISPAALIVAMDGVEVLNASLPWPSPDDRHCLIGTPMRGRDGRAIVHYNAWRMSSAELRVAAGAMPDRAAFDLAGEQAFDEGYVIPGISVEWAHVEDHRPSQTIRRDHGRPAAWFSGKRIVLLGCGALGAPIAEYCVRAGARALILVDPGVVRPGLLVRQPFTAPDVGVSKVVALQHRLEQLFEDVQVTALPVNVLACDEQLTAGADLVIDATASLAVGSWLELRRRRGGLRLPLLTVAIGRDAQRGLATLALPKSIGGGADLRRRIALAAYLEPGLSDLAEDMFPRDDSPNQFVPEWGCSGPTFLGSAMEVGALAAQMLVHSAAYLARASAGAPLDPAAAWVVRLDARTDERTWPAGVALDEANGAYEVRFSPMALAGLRAAVGSGEVGDETGGLLLGEIDRAAQIVWIDQATPSPADSVGTPTGFRLGQRGVAALLDEVAESSAGRTRLVGLWHTHLGLASPSAQDDHTMKKLLTDDHPPNGALLLILGGLGTGGEDWLRGGPFPDLYARVDFPR